MRVQAIKVAGGFLIPFEAGLSDIPYEKILLDIERIEPPPGEPVASSFEEDDLQREMLSFIQAYRHGDIKPRKNAWKDIQKICVMDQPPYPTLEEAMQAIRYRYLPYFSSAEAPLTTPQKETGQCLKS